MWWMPHEGIGWWMLFGGLWMVVFWAVVIGIAVWGIRALTDRGEQGTRREDPLGIAQRRYANGEITKEQFEEMKATLRS